GGRSQAEVVAEREAQPGDDADLQKAAPAGPPEVRRVVVPGSRDRWSHENTLSFGLGKGCQGYRSYGNGPPGGIGGPERTHGRRRLWQVFALSKLCDLPRRVNTVWIGQS